MRFFDRLKDCLPKRKAEKEKQEVSRFEIAVFEAAKTLFERLGRVDIVKYTELAKLIFEEKQVKVGKELPLLRGELVKLRNEGYDLGSAKRAIARAGIEATITPEVTMKSLFDLARRAGIDCDPPLR